MIKLLIDECLTPDLVEIARGRWMEADHVSWIGLAGTPDWKVVASALEADYAVVTNNGRDFKRLYKRIELHPGLLILVPQVRAAQQIALFRKVLDHIEAHPDMVNQLIEVDGAGRVTVTPWSSVTS